MDELAEPESTGADGPGEHQATFHHPNGAVPGVLELHAELPPRGIAYDLPLPEDGAMRDEDGTYRGHGFPAIERFEELSATLRSNLPVRLEEVTLSHWMPGHAYLDAAVAIVGWAANGDNPAFDRLRMQATGFAQFFGTRPIRHIIAPGLFDGRAPDEVTVGFEEHADLEWRTNEIHAAARWNTAIAGLGDAFHFEVKSSPWIEVTRTQVCSWQSWLHDWLHPIVDLVSLATGDGQQPTIVEVSRPGTDETAFRGRVTARVYGSGLKQAAFNVRFAHHRPALFTLAQLPYGLDELIARWLLLRGRLPGFVDAYLPIIRGARQTPAADLLLLATAAEAVHIARSGEGPSTAEEHTGRRGEVLERLRDAASDEDYIFLKRHLSRRDRYSFEQRIAALASSCPSELKEHLGLTDLATRVAALRNDLAHGRAVEHELLSPAIRALRGLLNVHLLLELGLPLDRVVAHERWEN